MIKWFDSKLMGDKIPVITNTQGDLVKMLNSLLVEGANSRAVTSLAWADGVCTLTVPNNHGFLIDSVIVLDGSSQSVLQGAELRVTSVSATTVSFKCTAVTNETGLVVRYAPIGWTKHFASEGRACYQSPDPRYPAFLRVDDTKFSGVSASAAKFSSVEICSNMTSFDAADWHEPYSATYPEQNRQSISGRSNGWFKWYYSSAYGATPDDGISPSGTRDYILIGDSTKFWLILYPYSDAGYKSIGSVVGMPLVTVELTKKQALVAKNGFGLGASVGLPHLSFTADAPSSIIPFFGEMGEGVETSINSAVLYPAKDILLQSPVFFRESSGLKFLSGVFDGVGVVPSKGTATKLLKSDGVLYKLIPMPNNRYDLVFNLGAE